MFKNKTKIIAIFLVMILLFSTTVVFAENTTADDGIMPISEDNHNVQNSTENSTNTTTSSNDDNYKSHDVYLVGNNITIDYVVDGNLFVCANTVTINSQIGGDAFIIAKNLTINKEGYVFSNLFVCADSIDIKGVVYGVYALAQNLTISGGYVYRDLNVSCNTLNVNGVVGRNAFVNCYTINFNTDETNNGIIYGNLNYTSDSQISIPENVVKGKVDYTPTPVSVEISVQEIITNFILHLGEFIVFVLIIWLACLLFAPKFLENASSYVGKKSLSILGYGLLTLLVVPIACIILILLQLTANVSLLLLALYILAIVISKSLFTITVNSYICSKLNINKNIGILGMLIISAFVVGLLTTLPYVGGILSFVITVLGLGILIFSILPKKVRNNTEKVSVDKKEVSDSKENIKKNDNNID